MIQTLLTDTAFRSIESSKHCVEIEIAPRALVQGVVRGSARNGMVIRGDCRHVPRLEARSTPFVSDTRQEPPASRPGQHGVDAHQDRNGDENNKGRSWWRHLSR